MEPDTETLTPTDAVLEAIPAVGAINQYRTLSELVEATGLPVAGVEAALAELERQGTIRVGRSLSAGRVPDGAERYTDERQHFVRGAAAGSVWG